MQLKDVAVFITGGGSGLGAATARAMAAKGAKVTVFDRSQENAEKVAAEIKGLAAIGDVTSESDVQAGLAKAEAANGVARILVNCAGGLITPMERSSASVSPDEDTRLLFAANFDSMLFCCQAVVPGMRARGSGVIVNLSSQSGVSTYPGGKMAMYAS